MSRHCLSIIFLVLMLNTYDPILRVLAVKINEIEWLNFQKTDTIQRVDHWVLTIWIDKSFFADSVHAHYIKTLFWESQVILGLIDEETRDLGLPQLEILKLLEHRTLIGFPWKVLHNYVVSIDVNGFVANY